MTPKQICLPRYLHSILLVSIIFLTSHSINFAQSYNPTNMNFEFPIMRSDSLPTGWEITNSTKEKGYKAKISNISHSGEYSLLLYSDTLDINLIDPTGLVHQSIFPSAYLGKKVTFSAYCRGDGKASLAPNILWIKIYTSDKYFTNYISNSTAQVAPNEWKRYEVTAEIPKNAVKVEFGLMLKSAGKIWMDDAEFALAGNADYTSLQLNQNQLKELTAYAKFISSFLFYYPDPRLAGADLRTVVEHGVDNILSSNASIEQKIKNIYTFTGNNLQFSKSNKSTYNFKKIDSTAAYDDNYYPGFRLYKGMYDISPKSLFSSKFQNWYRNFREFPNLLTQNILVSDYKDKEFKFQVFTKNILINSYSKSFAIIAFKDENRNIISVTIPEPKKLKNKNDWQELSISGIIPQNCITIDINLFLDGEGRALFDDASLIIEGKEQIKNGDFENFISGWFISEKSENVAYKIVKNISEKRSGFASIELKVSNDENIIYPKLNDIYNLKIDDNLFFQFPKVRLTNANDTTQFIKLENKTYQLFNNYSARIASVIYTWAFLNNFSMLKDKTIDNNNFNKNIIAELESAINNASIIKTEDELIRILEKLGSYFPDNALRFWNTLELSKQTKALPIAFQYIDNKLYIKNSNFPEIPIGSRVLKINSIPIEEYFRNERNYISSTSEEYKNIKIATALRYNYNDKIDTFLIENEKKPYEIIIKNDNIENNYFASIFPPDSLINNEIYYINLTQHNEKTISDLFKQSSSKMSGIIFDLRGYTSISEYFFKFFKNGIFDNIIWKTPYYTEYNASPTAFANYMQKVDGIGNLSQTKVIVLCDEKTIGLAEAHLHLLRQNKLATFIGSETAGAPTEATVVPLPCDLSISISGISAYDKDGNKLIGKSFRPDVIINTSLNDIKSNKDPVIEASIKMMKQLIK